MRLPFNPRWIIVTVILLLLAGGAIGGYWYYKNRPEHIYLAAQTYYNAGEEFRKKEQHQAAVENFERADQQLEMLLQPNRAPAYAARGWLLRYKTRIEQARSLAKVEDANNTPTDQRKSPEIQKLAVAAGAMAASLDPSNLEAHGSAMLDSYLRANDESGTRVGSLRSSRDRRGGCDPDRGPAGKSERGQESGRGPSAGAYFLVARHAWANGSKEAKPDEVLANVQEAHKWEQLSESRKDRWRTIDLEARAMERQADQLDKIPPHPSPTAKKDAETIRNELRKKMAGWLDRARLEVEGSDRPTAPNQPPQSGVVNLSNTEGRGFFAFLLQSIVQAETHDEVMERTEILLDAATKVTDKVVRPTNPPLLRRAATEAVAKVANSPDLPGAKSGDPPRRSN